MDSEPLEQLGRAHVGGSLLAGLFPALQSRIQGIAQKYVRLREIAGIILEDLIKGFVETNCLHITVRFEHHLIGLGVPPTRIAAYGELLGSGQAVRLAAARPLAGVVLEAPLTSTIDVARSTYFWLPTRLLITDKYDNERNIRSVTAPVLILHGEQDGVIPVEMGRRVFRAANEPKRIEVFPQGTHDDLFSQGAWEKTRSFLDSLGGR